MSRVALSLVVLAGCDKLFSLEQIDHVDDGGPTPDANAPCTTTLERDEDGDGCPNTTDLCPTTADPLQLDGDHDGVGDECDPHPALGGDSIIDVSYFNGMAIDGAWTPTTMTGWSVGDGMLRTFAPLELYIQMLGSTNSYPTIEINYTARVFVSTLSSMRVSATTNNGYAVCHVDYNDPTFDAFVGSTSFGYLPSSITTFRLVLRPDDAGTTCSVNSLEQTIPTFVPAGPTLALIQIIDQLQADISSIVAYQYVPQ